MAVQGRRMTVEEFDQFVEQPENAEKLFEYIGGEVLEVPSNPYSSHLAVRIIRRLAAFVEDHDLGYVTTESGGYMVSGERYAPDVAYISKLRQPRLAERGYNPNPPDLAVEILSPSNDLGDMRIKVANYLSAGTTVWIVNPDRKQVEVYVPGAAARRIGPDGTLDGGKILPGFTLAVKAIFPE